MAKSFLLALAFATAVLVLFSGGICDAPPLRGNQTPTETKETADQKRKESAKREAVATELARLERRAEELEAESVSRNFFEWTLRPESLHRSMRDLMEFGEEDNMAKLLNEAKREDEKDLLQKTIEVSRKYHAARAELDQLGLDQVKPVLQLKRPVPFSGGGDAQPVFFPSIDYGETYKNLNAEKENYRAQIKRLEADLHKMAGGPSEWRGYEREMAESDGGDRRRLHFAIDDLKLYNDTTKLQEFLDEAKREHEKVLLEKTIEAGREFYEVRVKMVKIEKAN